MSEPMATCCYCGTCPTCAGTMTAPPVADPVAFAHGAIKHRMLARIGSVEVDGDRPLGTLTTRDDDDPTIALLDAFAGSLHILAWNTGRLYDDGTIRRTEDRDALVDLTRLLGYEPRPALAATTTLSFTLDSFDASPKVATIPKGAKVASIPGQDEKPQIFETDAEIEARAEWNALKPALQKKSAPVGKSTASIVIVGTASPAKTGDMMLIYLKAQASSTQWLCARIADVARDPNAAGGAQTRIGIAAPLELTADKKLKTAAGTVLILAARAAAFGAGAPDLALMTKDIRDAQKPPDPPTDWKGLVMGTGGIVDLDAVHADAVKGRLVFFSKGPSDDKNNEIGHIDEAIERSRAGFALSAKVSRIKISGINFNEKDNDSFHTKVRETAIYIESAREHLFLADEDIAMPESPFDRIVVPGKVQLPVGRRIVLTGEEWKGAGKTGPRIAEVAVLRACAPSGGTTELQFERKIVSRFRSTTLALLANSVAASHGETPASGAELLGSGQASTLSPRFQIKGAPLAYVPAINPRGYAPAIDVRVGGRLYGETASLYGLDSADRTYTVKQVRDGKSEIQFAGRLPSGMLNVTALYRVGGGTAGNLAAGRISTAMAPILGVGAVSNAVPADGASDAETIDDMRSAAPQSIRTLDRVVSLADFEAFARSFRGIGKALASELHVGMRSVVCLTVAGSDLSSPVPGSDVIETLIDALKLVAAPGRSIRVEGFTDLTANLTVALAIDPALRRADVEAAVRAVLGADFGRAARNFGEALHRSAVLAAIHKIDGVVAATLPVFAVQGGPPEDDAGRLLCPAPSIVNGTFNKAGLLSINPETINFAEMAP